MKRGITRFEHFLDKLQDLLLTASKQKNPALWLYQNDARTSLFMLEGLSKLYAGIHNKNKFVKIENEFKLLEDTLGAIDYYDVFAREFAQRIDFPAPILAYLEAQAREKIQSLNEILTQKHWLGDVNSNIDQFKKKLAKVDWLDGKEEVKCIESFYRKAIANIIKFASISSFHFQNVETEVHALRRKLRWLSIYPQALPGCIQLSKEKNTPAYIPKYLTPEILSSPFNKMPDAGNNKHFLLLEEDHYFALSWMIDKLGTLKDAGLRVIAVKEALQQTSVIAEKEAFDKAYEVLGKEQATIQQVLDNADQVCKTYFKEGNLDKLVIGISSIVK